jgi:hypothetical protein
MGAMLRALKYRAHGALLQRNYLRFGNYSLRRCGIIWDRIPAVKNPAFAWGERVDEQTL